MAKIELYNMDCMEAMAEMPDKAYELAIVDPPYGIGVNSMKMGSRKTVRPDNRKWDDETPPPRIFYRTAAHIGEPDNMGRKLLQPSPNAMLYYLGQGGVNV